ncbi:hypothetical protein Enr13x_70930 [Stieleria neptunia]|uniref:Uncharacterized protein n=1 Tax=Stieleria neptunia TaxID=2527979 RepID=A0A518I2B3_9BACT|nr:hypothetical protein [Stieleria neptunia]QDV47184.1 hypothetical protein Enr13x_70930 [Stieleria neptunia]
MYLLSCPNCHAELTVTPAQAGDSTSCPQCHADVAIPKLGELRELPQVGDAPDQPAATAPSGGSTIVFLMLGLIAVALLVGAGYNAVRWAMIETTTTTESHLAEIEESYARVEPASVILEFEDMEVRSLDLVSPYTYHVVVTKKSRLGWNAVITASLALVCGIGAFGAASLGRSESRS